MKLHRKNIIVVRPYKSVYHEDDRIVKVFTKEHGKANVFNEALCTARVEESGLDISPVLEVAQIDDGWAIALQYVEGETLEEKMNKDPVNIDLYMDKFVDLQLKMHSKTSPRLNLQRGKFLRKIASLKDKLDPSVRYELNARLTSMPLHTKICHGDFNPSNVIVRGDGSMAIIDWSHVTQGNASGDAALTYLYFALKNQKTAELYLEKFCLKSDTPRQYVHKWIPIAAAVQLTKGISEEEEYLLRWMDILDFQ